MQLEISDLVLWSDMWGLFALLVALVATYYLGYRVGVLSGVKRCQRHRLYERLEGLLEEQKTRRE